MANIEGIIPHILKWETGVIKKTNETNQEYFERCRKKGWSNDPLDRGGQTQSGLTLSTYRVWCTKHGVSQPSAENLKNIPYRTWLVIMKELFWDKCNADKIISQSVANILVDYMWGSGILAVKKVQTALGLVSDGIVGNKTINAINSKSPLPLFGQIKEIRKKHYNAIVNTNPSQKKWLNGWMNRLNDLKFTT